MHPRFWFTLLTAALPAGILLLAACPAKRVITHRRPPRRASPSAPIRFDERAFTARLAKGQLHLELPYRCHKACQGSLAAVVKTIAGKKVAGTIVPVPASKAGRLRLVLPLAMSFEAAELLSLEYTHRRNKQWARGTISLASILLGPQLLLLGHPTLVAGRATRLRILLQDLRSSTPFGDVAISATLSAKGQPPLRHAGTTNAQGIYQAVFRPPAALIGKYVRLGLRAKTRQGLRTLSAKFRVVDPVGLHLSTDKPLYQPGQVMHLRALALRPLGGAALSGATITFEVRDGRQILVFRRPATSNRFGIAHARFDLAKRVNQGTYKVRALLARPDNPHLRAEKTVKVQSYRQPRLQLRTRFERGYYRPGQEVRGTLTARDLFGKPAAGSRVNADVSIDYGGRSHPLLTLKGRTGKDGSFGFRFRTKPNSLAGKYLNNKVAHLVVRATVRGPGGEVQLGSSRVPLSGSDLLLSLYPESGALVGGLPQRIYVLAHKPDGSPAEGTIKVQISPVYGNTAVVHREVLKTDKLGIASFEWRPPPAYLRFGLQASDHQGGKGRHAIQLYSSLGGSSTALLLRPDRALYRPGERLNATLFSAQKSGRAQVDLVQAGQLIASQTVLIESGRARIALAIPATALGVSTLLAHAVAPTGKQMADARSIFVQEAKPLRVTVTADRPAYAPRQKARLSFLVTNSAGQATQAALGITIVDRAVSTLAGKLPGDARTFFQLDAELRRGGARVGALRPATLLMHAPNAAARALQERAAEVLLAAIAPNSAYPLQADSLADHRAVLNSRVSQQLRPVLDRLTTHLATAYQRFYKRHRKKHKCCPSGPPELEALAKMDPALGRLSFRDPWGRLYGIQLEGHLPPAKVTVMSAGLDRRLESRDDIKLTRSIKIPKCRVACRIRYQGIDPERDVATLGKQPIFGPEGEYVGCRRSYLGDRCDLISDDLLTPLYSLSVPRGGRVAPWWRLWPASAPSRKGVGKASPRPIRQFFPEALYVNPSLITDAKGRASISVPLADSITTWELSALASTPLGRLAGARATVKMSGPFFADLSLPPALIRGDRISVPVAVHNHGRRALRARVALRRAAWFQTVGGPAAKWLRIPARSVRVARFMIQANRVGEWRLQVSARGPGVADALARAVSVTPAGYPHRRSISGLLDKAQSHEVSWPKALLGGSRSLTLEVSDGPLATVEAGLDGLLRRPHGCFEQLASTIYPNVLILRYLKATGQASPRVAARARRLIAEGYQALASYEDNYGGFPLYKGGNASLRLTAYGLRLLEDMARVYPVDPVLLRRGRGFLCRRYNNMAIGRMDLTFYRSTSDPKAEHLWQAAYLAHFLPPKGSCSSYTKLAVKLVAEHLPKLHHAYGLAQAAALFARAKKPKLLERAFARLDKLRVDEGRVSSWPAGPLCTFTCSSPRAARIETTALITRLMLESGTRLAVVKRALRYVMETRDPSGAWPSTQATILSLKALVAAAVAQNKLTKVARGTVEVKVNGRLAGRIKLTPKAAGARQKLALTRLVRSGQKATIALRYQGQGSPAFQLHSAGYLPGHQSHGGQGKGPLSLQVAYAKQKLRPGEPVSVTVTVKTNHQVAHLPLIELSRPAGFRVLSGDLEGLVRRRLIARYEILATRIVIYLDHLRPRSTRRFSYRLVADHPARVTAAPSVAYPFYASAKRARSAGLRLTVAGKPL